MLLRICGMVVLLCYGAAAENANEKALRLQLKASEAARLQAIRDKEALKKLLDKATTSTAAVQASGAAASRSAGAAQMAAAETVATIQDAAFDARAAAAAALQQAEQLRHSTNANAMAMIIGNLLVLIGVVGGFVHSAFMAARTHKWAMEEAERTRGAVLETQKVIQVLEKNTNSMVEVMRKSAFTEGTHAANGISDARVAEAQKVAFAEGLAEGQQGG